MAGEGATVAEKAGAGAVDWSQLRWLLVVRLLGCWQVGGLRDGRHGEVAKEGRLQNC